MNHMGGGIEVSRYVEDVHTTNAHHNAAQIGNEPLGGVEAENTDSVEPLQSQSDQRLCRSRDLGIVLLECPRLPLPVSLCPTTRESNSYNTWSDIRGSFRREGRVIYTFALPSS